VESESGVHNDKAETLDIPDSPANTRPFSTFNAQVAIAYHTRVGGHVNPDTYLNGVIWALIGALPWFAGFVLVCGVVAWSPLGKLMVRHLRDRARTDALLEANNVELLEVARALATMTERLDATEQLLLRLTRGDRAFPKLPPPAADVPGEAWTPTPH
jgi:hypothetical protein